MTDPNSPQPPPYGQPGQAPYGAPPPGPQYAGGVPPMPPTYPGYPGQPPKKSKRGLFAALGGVGGVVVIIAVLLIVVGVKHSQNHQVEAAEKVVKEVVEADTTKEVSADLAPGFKVTGCTQAQLSETDGGEYRITSSKKDGDDGAKVAVEFKDPELHLEFQLTNNEGWKVDSFACTD